MIVIMEIIEMNQIKISREYLDLEIILIENCNEIVIK